MQVVDVIVVGGGPAGLAASLVLARGGVRTVLVDRHAAVGAHPRAHIVNTRTVELLRGWGLERAVRRASAPVGRHPAMWWLTSLDGEVLGRLSLGDDPEELTRRAAASPAQLHNCPQYVVERLLERAAREAGVVVLRSTELLDHREEDTGVVAEVRGVGSEVVRRIHAQYLVAADGASSPVRERLSVPLEGTPPLGRQVTISFTRDLRRWTRARPGLLHWIVGSEVNGALITLDGRRHWTLNLTAWGPDPTAVPTPEEAAVLVSRAVGPSGPDPATVEVHSVRPWTMTGDVAARYRVGRTFLVGDAAHRFPPIGGYGMNTGIQDAANLGWKLAAVLRGRAADALLDTYEQERRPIALSNAAVSVAGAGALGDSGIGRSGLPLARMLEEGGPAAARARALIAAALPAQRLQFPRFAQELGFPYDRGALVPDGTPVEHRRDGAGDDGGPPARPGARAPHVWLTAGPLGRLRSTLDLFGDDFVLLAAPGARAWATAALAQVRGPVVVRVETIGATGRWRDAPSWRVAARDLTRLARLDRDTRARVRGPARGRRGARGTWQHHHGLEHDGAVLVRPDGHVAWRARSCSDLPPGRLREVLDATLGNPPRGSAPVAGAADPPVRPSRSVADDGRRDGSGTAPR